MSELELHKALGDIGSIRRQMANTTEFRGYGPATLASTAYLALWFVTAALAATLTGAQMYTRARRIHSGLSNEMLRMAVEQFLPSAGAGVLLTLVFALHVPAAFYMLPGLWQIVFSLGIFASCRFLPRPIIAAGAWYLLTGLLWISFGDDRALAPWTMGLGFGAGQLLVAGILWVAAPEGAE